MNFKINFIDTCTCHRNVVEQTSIPVTLHTVETTMPQVISKITPQATSETISILYRLSSDIFLSMMTLYLRVPETVKLLLTCRRFQRIANTVCLWKILFKIKNENYHTDSFYHLIQSWTQDVTTQELAYHRLYGLRAQGLEDPWSEELKLKFPVMPFGVIAPVSWFCQTITLLWEFHIAK